MSYKLVKILERKYYKYKNVANGYRELSSLQTNEVTDSGIQCTTKVSFEYVAAMKSIETYRYFLYNNNYALGTWMISGYETSTVGFSLHYKSQLYATNVQPTVDKYHKFSTDFTTSSKKYYIDDSQKVTISDSSVQNLAGNILFGDGYWSAKYIKLFDENYNVIRFFKPCERISDNTYGWYDTINDIFYPVSTIVEAGDYVAEEGTSSDYDFYEDIPVYKLKKIPGEIIYLKNFTNPGNMTSNGTLGGNTFAVEGTAKSSGNNLYQIMGDNIDWTKLYEHRQNSGYITFYNPTPFKLEKFTVQVNGNAPSINCVMYGSNDNTNWTQVASRPTSSTTAVPDVWTINSPDFYKYYKYTYDATNYYSQGKATLIYYLHVSGYTEGTAQDYDAVLDTTKYELPSDFNRNYRTLEYVETDGTQAVNLGVTVGTSKMEANIDAQITNIPNSTYTGWFLTFGTGLGGPGEGIGLGIRKENSSSSAKYSCIEPGVNWNTFSTATLDRTQFKWVINGNNSVVSGYASNNVTASNIFGNSCQWRNENRTTVAGHLQDSTYIDLLSCKYYALDILLDDNKVRDLIPVERKSDGVGGLYDKVTNTFYRSVLSDFIKGPYV